MMGNAISRDFLIQMKNDKIKQVMREMDGKRWLTCGYLEA